MAPSQTKDLGESDGASSDKHSRSHFTAAMIVFAFLFAAIAVAQNSSTSTATSAMFDSGVPTNSPVP